MTGLLVTAVAAFGLLVAAALLIVRPFLRRTSPVQRPRENGLAADKERLLDQIRELDLDFATGKLSEQDHEELRAAALADAADALRALDEARQAHEAAIRDEQAAEERAADEETASGRRSAPRFTPNASHDTGSDELERAIAERRAALEGDGCPVCGAGRSPHARSCADCGAEFPPVTTR